MPHCGNLALGGAWLVKIMLSFAMLLLIIDPAFIPHRLLLLKTA
jgi:hypothetical protein